MGGHLHQSRQDALELTALRRQGQVNAAGVYGGVEQRGLFDCSDSEHEIRFVPYYLPSGRRKAEDLALSWFKLSPTFPAAASS